MNLNSTTDDGLALVHQTALDAFRERIAELEATLAELREQVTETAYNFYCAGYEKGHSDCAESHYAPPDEYPEEFPAIYAEYLELRSQDNE